MAVPRTWAAGLAISAIAASAAALAVAGPASAGAPALRHFHANTVINYHPVTHLRPTGQMGKLAGGLPTFTAKQTDGAKTFSFTMVGKNPRVKQATPSTTVNVKLIPIDFVFPDTSSTDPTVGNTCDSTPAVTRTLNSPVVKNVSWTFGGKSIGTTQYTDAFQRAEFWKFTKPGAINPGYHVKLAYSTLPKVTINVPAADAGSEQISCGFEYAVEINWLDNYLQTTVMPSLAQQGLIGPNVLPMFLSTNTIEYDTSLSNCCILGYHSAYNVSNGIQTYGISDYETGGAFAPQLTDIEIASHEIAEWMNDPLGNNLTKPWGHIGQVSGCQNNLEVGDPLTGNTITRKIGTYSYHLQEMAFFSWFYHQKPSVGVNGWYSNKGTFKTPAKLCS
jgi:hypothetical protein